MRTTERAKNLPLTSLTTKEARRLPKPHTGFEQWIAQLAVLYDQHAGQLGSGGVDVDLMTTSLANYEALAAPQAKAHAQASLLDDTRLLHGSRAWSQLLLLYRRARIAAETNPDIAHAIAGMAKWMKQGPRKKAAQP